MGFGGVPRLDTDISLFDGADLSRRLEVCAVKKPHVYPRTYGIEKPNISDRIQTGKKLIFVNRNNQG